MRGGNIARFVLRLPGEAFAHGVPRDLIAKAGERNLLARVPRALDELHHAHAPAMTECPQHQPKRGRRLALARACMHQQHALLDLFGRNLGVLHGLALGHFAFVAIGVDRVHFVIVAHGLKPFKVRGRPAATNSTRSATAAMR